MTGLTVANGCSAVLSPRGGGEAAMAVLTAAASLAKPAAIILMGRRRRITRVGRAHIAAAESGTGR